MPKITALPRTIAGRHLALELWYNAKRLFFIEKGLPEDFYTNIDYKYRLENIPNQATIEKLLDEAIIAYEETLRNRDEVLVVFASIGVETMRAMGCDMSGRRDYPLRGGYSDQYHGFTFYYQRLIRVTVGDAVTFVEENPNTSPFRREGDPEITTTKARIDTERNYIIEYTPERQQVLEQFIAATAAMGQKMADFFGKEPAQLLASLDNGQKLLG